MTENRNVLEMSAMSGSKSATRDYFLKMGEVCERYDVTTRTLRRWVAERDFPEPISIHRKNYFSAAEVSAWETKQAGRDINAEFALGCKIVSPVIQTYAELQRSLKDRKIDLGLTNNELEARSGMTDGYVAKLEAYPKGENSRGMGPETFPLWLGGLRVGIVLVDLPRRPKKRRHDGRAE